MEYNTQTQNQPALYRLAGVVIMTVGAVIITSMVTAEFNRYTKARAVEECAQSARFEKTNEDGSKVSHELPDHYKQCLKDKGITE